MNLIDNPSFETDTSGWLPNNAVTLSRDTVTKKYGDASLKAVTAGTTAYEGPVIWPPERIVEEGLTYTYSVWAWVPSGSSIQIWFDWRDGADVYISSSTAVVITGNNDWQRAEITATAPAGAVGMNAGHYTFTAQALTFYIDGALFEARSEASDFDAPSVTFQVAFESQPMVAEAMLLWETVPGTQAMAYARGAPNEYGQTETGQSEIQVGDAASDLDPNNTASRWYPNVKRGKAIRALLTINGVNYPLFQHFVERLPRTARVGQVWTQRTITGVDAFGQFALAGIKGQSYEAETTGSRWDTVLFDINWPSDRRNIDTGNSSLDPITFADDSDERALSHLLEVVDNENGLGFMDAEGNARFIERHAMIANTTVQAIFADDESIDTGSYPTALKFTGLAPESTDIVNDYTGKRESGTTQTASDSASINDYGTRSQEINFQVDSDNVVLDAINWRLSRTKDPHERVDAITVMPGTDPDKWVTLVGLEIGDNVTVVEWPPGYPAPVETQYVIRHLSVKLPTALSGAEFTFQLTPSSVDNWLVLDDAVFGKLDENKLAY